MLVLSDRPYLIESYVHGKGWERLDGQFSTLDAATDCISEYARVPARGIMGYRVLHEVCVMVGQAYRTDA